MDIFDKEKRSEVMSSIKSKGNMSTELALISLFRKFGVIGWRRNSSILGHPDFVFRGLKIAVFVDGCFWHGCPICNRSPKTNKAYWKTKITRNKKRDRLVSTNLRLLGWAVIRIKECRLKKFPLLQIVRVKKMISLRENFKSS